MPWPEVMAVTEALASLESAWSAEVLVSLVVWQLVPAARDLSKRVPPAWDPPLLVPATPLDPRRRLELLVFNRLSLVE